MLAKLLVLAVSAVMVQGHSYHLGGCPTVEPFPEFEMSKFLGKWYAIQKIHTVSRCLTYNFTVSSVPDEYDLEQVSEHPVLGLADVDNKYHYTGHLFVPDPNTPAEMIARFPLSVAGRAVYTVFSTDYDNYGAVFTCQSALKLGHRRSVTILSRRKTLSQVYLDQILSKLSDFGIHASELDTIDQSNCPGSNGESVVDINVNEKTNSDSQEIGESEWRGDDVQVEAGKPMKLLSSRR